MSYGLLISGAPVPFATRGKYWTASNGDQVLVRDLAKEAVRTRYGVVIIQPFGYDAKLETPSPTPTYVDLGNGVWQESNTVTNRPMNIQSQVMTSKILAKKKAVLRSGVDVLGYAIPTTSEEIDNISLTAMALSLGEPFPANYKIATMDATRLPISQANFTVLVRELAKHFYLTDKNADTHLAALQVLIDAGDTQGVRDYDITTPAWPANPVVGDI